MTTDSTTSTLPRFDRDAAADDFVAALGSHGACIVERRLTDEQVERLRGDLDPLIASSSTGNDDFHGVETTRIGALLSHSGEVRTLATDELILEVANAYLGQWCHRIQLMLTQVIAIGGGETDQLLHRDRLAWGGFIPREIEPQLNTIWAVNDFTADNGATRVVPGSQAWPAERQALDSEVVQAEMPAGSVLVYSGSVVHGGGANRTDGVRVGINIDYCLDWLRQEENQYLSYPPKVASAFPPELAALIGYTGGGLVLGYWSDLDDADDRGLKQAEAAAGNYKGVTSIIEKIEAET